MISKMLILMFSLYYLCHCMDSTVELNYNQKKNVKTALYTIKSSKLIANI